MSVIIRQGHLTVLQDDDGHGVIEFVPDAGGEAERHQVPPVLWSWVRSFLDGGAPGGLAGRMIGRRRGGG